MAVNPVTPSPRDPGSSRTADYRVSGHESFPCRYSWLPKAVRGLAENPMIFSDEDAAMVTLGVGKNMVRSRKQGEFGSLELLEHIYDLEDAHV